MKYILLLISLISCGGYNPSNNIVHTTADVYDWAKYKGRTIAKIDYYRYASTLPGCDDLVIVFDDATVVRCHVYKYLLKVSEL